jgi:hypothetical protein
MREDALLTAYLAAADAAIDHLVTGDELARLALELASRARRHWEASHKLLDAAERCARELARRKPDLDRWPEGLEAGILAELERRDAANDR